MKLPKRHRQDMKLVLRPYDEDDYFRHDEDEEKIKKDGFVLFLVRANDYYSRDADIVLDKALTVNVKVPQDMSELDLMNKAIETLQEKIKEEHVESERRVIKFQKLINSLTLLEHKI